MSDTVQMTALGRQRTAVEFAYSARERDGLLEAGRAAGKKIRPGDGIQRYQGLGEMAAKELWETAMDPAVRLLRAITIGDAAAADNLFSILMGEDVDARRQFIGIGRSQYQRPQLMTSSRCSADGSATGVPPVRHAFAVARAPTRARVTSWTTCRAISNPSASPGTHLPRKGLSIFFSRCSCRLGTVPDPLSTTRTPPSTEAIHEQAVAETAVAHRERVLIELVHHGPDDAGAREDHVRALWL